MRVTGAPHDGVFIVFDSSAMLKSCVKLEYITTSDGVYHMCAMTRVAIEAYVNELAFPGTRARREELEKVAQSHAQASRSHV